MNVADHLGVPSVSQGSYEPGKRHWLKVKKDYLNEGAMADTADLVVLGAFYGKGSNGVKKQTLKHLLFLHGADLQETSGCLVCSDSTTLNF